MHRDIKLDNDAVTGLLTGVKKLADAVSTTLGPKGKYVLWETDYGHSKATKDGISVAKKVVLKDRHENLGAAAVRQASAKTNSEVGDGTTTSIVLANAIMQEASKYLATGVNGIDLTRGIEKAKNFALNIVKEASTPVSGDIEKIHSIAKISSNSDEEIAGLISSTMKDQGEDGVIIIEESKTGNTYIDHARGLRFNKGYSSPYFINSANNTVEYEDCLIYVTDRKLRGHVDVHPIASLAFEAKKPLVVICDDIDAQALFFMVNNKVKNGFPCVAIKAPAFAQRRKDILQDIAIATGATVISENAGLTPEQVELKHLGKAMKVQISQFETTLIETQGDKKKINERADYLKGLVKASTSEFETEKLKERIANLIAGISRLYVGGKTEIEMREKKDRVEDALSAVRAAIQGGISPGGGVSFLNMLTELDELKVQIAREGNLSYSEMLGYDCFMNALKVPLMTIAENAGKSSALVLEKVSQMPDHEGYNAQNDTYGNMFEMGIIDPTLVIYNALDNAVSVCSVILNTNCVLIEADDHSGVNERPGILDDFYNV